MRVRNMSWKYIGHQLGLTPNEARLAIFPEWERGAKPARIRPPAGKSKFPRKPAPIDLRTKAQKAYVQSPAPNHYVPSFTPPNEVLLDRELRTKLQPRSLTAAIMGDPLPGFSALDRKPDASMARISNGD